MYFMIEVLNVLNRLANSLEVFLGFYLSAVCRKSILTKLGRPNREESAGKQFHIETAQTIKT